MLSLASFFANSNSSTEHPLGLKSCSVTELVTQIITSARACQDLQMSCVLPVPVLCWEPGQSSVVQPLAGSAMVPGVVVSLSHRQNSHCHNSRTQILTLSVQRNATYTLPTHKRLLPGMEAVVCNQHYSLAWTRLIQSLMRFHSVDRSSFPAVSSCWAG